MGERYNIMNEIWGTVRADLTAKLADPEEYTEILYYVQIYTNLLFDCAFQKKDTAVLDQLVELYMIPLDQLVECREYWFFNADYNNGYNGYASLMLPEPHKMWLKKMKMPSGEIFMERILGSTQYLYLMAHVINCICTLEDAELTPNMRIFVEQYTPVVLDHFQRWIFMDNGSVRLDDSLGVFQVRGWGCNDGRFNHRQFMEHKLNREFGDVRPHVFCNAVLDTDLWIGSGAVELLAARKKKPGLFSLEPERETDFEEYFSLWCRIIEDRMSPSTVLNFEKEELPGCIFDAGFWKGYKDMRYAGYEGDEFPEDNREDPPVVIVDPADYPVPDTISWDTSHARRFVQVFETFYRNRDITGVQMPTTEMMRGLANQAAYAVFSQNFEKPLFRNYFDGANGWYRVNYSGREQFGYAKWDRSIEWLSGGFVAWKQYQPDLERIAEMVWTMINSTDPQIINHRSKHYENNFYSEGKRVWRDTLNLGTSIHMLNFLSSWELLPMEEVQEDPDDPPPDPLDPAKLGIDRNRLYFAAGKDGVKTGPQEIVVSNLGEKQLCWKAETSAPWLYCRPASGKDSSVLLISVNPRRLAAGKYNGTVTVSDPNAVDSPKTIDVSLKVYSPTQEFVPKGCVDTPANGAKANGAVPISGWAIDKVGIKKVRIHVQLPHCGDDLINIGEAVFVPDTRPDIVHAYPTHPQNYRAGWGYNCMTHFLPGKGNGSYVLHAIAENLSGVKKTIGITTINCDNNHSKKPFGSLDFPAQGGVASGKKYRVRGWALTSRPNKIPEGGSTIRVFIDGKYVGDAKYNHLRADIRDRFPGYLNSHGAGIFFDFDTTKYANGVHTIALGVVDNAGNRAGIGSRHFTIRN